MNSSILTLMIVISTVWLILHVCFTLVVRPVLLFAIQRLLVELRDELRLAARSGEIGTDEKGFKILDQNLLLLSSRPIETSFTMLAYRIDPSARMEMDREKGIIDQSSQLIREISERGSRLTFAAVMVNSPMWWFFVPFVIVLAPVSKKAKRWYDCTWDSATTPQCARVRNGVAAVHSRDLVVA